MRLKSYFASTVEAAMALARQELGDEAMLVNSRRTTPENRSFGDYEVVFATVPEDPARQHATAAAGAPDAAGAEGVRTDLVVNLADQIAGLKRQVERMSSQFARTRVTAGPARMKAETAYVLSMLLDADVEEETAGEIASQVGEHPIPSEALASVLSQLIRFDPTLGRTGKARRIVAFVGPPGSGKTTTLVKIAARYGVAGKRPTQIISADSVRIAAADQLRSYAAILGLGFQSVETSHSLSIALDEHRHKDLILIDTPGLASRDFDEATALASLLANHPEVDVHLVAPASMRASDLTRMLKKYEIFNPSKLLFTKLDETDSPGVLINEAVRTGLPVSFVTMGQQVPEDMEPADVGVFAGLLKREVSVEEIAAGAR